MTDSVEFPAEVSPDSVAMRRRREDRLLAANEELRASARLFHEIFQYAQVGLCLVDSEATIIRVNPQFSRIFGYEPEELEGQNVVGFFPEDVRPDLLSRFRVMLDGENSPADWQVQTRTGQTRSVRICGLHRFELDGQRFLLGSFLDITEQLEAERRLRESEERERSRSAELEGVLNAAPAAIWIAHDPECRDITGNLAAYELVRMPAGTNPSASASPDIAERRTFREYRDGTLVPGPELPIQIAASRGVEVRGAELTLAFDDGAVRHIVGNATPLRNPDGTLRGAVAAFMDITDRKRAEQEQAEQGRRKDEFLAMLSHELRNPLGAVTSAVALLQRLGMSDPTLQMARDIIERQAAHLTRIVDDLLDVSRITSGKIAVEKRRISAGDAITLAAETIRPTLEPRRQKLLLSLTPVPVEAVADASRLAQAIGNLLHNASKYSPDGGRIWLSLQSEGEEAVIRVRDEGLGIPADLLPRVFEPFVQGSWVLDSSLDQSRRGLGVGLTLVRSIVELHGGSVEAASEGLGRGSEFTIRLPALARGGKDRGSGEARKAEGSVAASGRRVLVVDDSIDSAAGLARLLDMSGYQVRTAHDGESALSAAAEFHPDIVLLDIGLPNMDGYETARRIRQIPGLSAVDLVALTGYGQASDRRRARDAGFDRHIVKPVAADELLRLIQTPRHA